MRYIAIFDLPEGEKHSPNAYAYIYPPTGGEKQQTIKGRLQEIARTGIIGDHIIVEVNEQTEE